MSLKTDWGLGRIAVLIPCYNEALSIAKVVCDFREQLPKADIYVYDNNSRDDTASVALQAGAIVRYERLQGKGNVVRRMFADIDADTYILIDGDGTYDVASVHALLDAYQAEQVDMVNAIRIEQHQEAYRLGHRFGNQLFTYLCGLIFGHRSKDLFCGYRIFSRRFVKSFPCLSRGFEIETELTIHALELRMATVERETPYYARQEGSSSKLRTYSDGCRILWKIAGLVREERPMQFFFSVFVGLAFGSVALMIPVVIAFANTHEVYRQATTVLATGMMLLGFLSLACGLILDTVTRGRQEMKRMQYLAIPSPACISDPVAELPAELTRILA